MSPITPGARSPPTSPGQQDALMNLDPFGQLSLSPGRGNTNGMTNEINSNMAHNNFAMASVNINNSDSNSPKSPMQQSGGHAPSSTTLNTNSFNPQPMVVSPEHGAGTRVPSAQQSNSYDPFQGYGISPQPFVQGQNNQHVEQQPVNRFQQHHFVQQTYPSSIPQQTSPNQQQMVQAHVPTNQTQPYANYTYNNTSVVNNSSPPVSPLYTPASPQSNQQRQAPIVPNSPPPSLPTGNPFDDAFGTSSAPGASNFSHVSGTSADPFGTDAFDGGTTASIAASGTNNNNNSNIIQDEADFWADMGFGVNPSGNANNTTSPTNKTDIQTPSSPSNTSNSSHDTEPVQNEEPLLLDANNLPTKGEYYTARVTKPLLGAIFSSGRELRNTLYSSASDQIVDAIGDRPVVSFTIDGSAADTAGIQLGHVLIKVNGEEVKSTDDAVKMVGKSPRPLKMEMYIPPDVKVVKTEGQYMVKYDSNSTEAPSTCTEWKPKYVVAGDMLGKPHMLYMYRSKVRFGQSDEFIEVFQVLLFKNNSLILINFSRPSMTLLSRRPKSPGKSSQSKSNNSTFVVPASLTKPAKFVILGRALGTTSPSYDPSVFPLRFPPRGQRISPLCMMESWHFWKGRVNVGWLLLQREERGTLLRTGRRLTTNCEAGITMGATTSSRAWVLS